MLNVSSFSWYFTRISRIKAENLLHQEFNIVGSFIIRESNALAFRGSYAISIKSKKKEGRGMPGFAFRQENISIFTGLEKPA